jgi:hypothetical protein
VNRESWGWAALVVAAIFATIGVSAGLGNDHQGAIPALLVAFAALAAGMALLKR